MVIQGILLVSFAFSLAALPGCQAPSRKQDEAVASRMIPDAVEQDDESEGLVGPDEAFFAAYYLKQVFHLSKNNTSPGLSEEAGLIETRASIPALDFEANFTAKRLTLMTQTLFSQGDLDKDGMLTAQEFAGLRVDPGLLGSDTETISHAFDQAFFLRVAGADELMQMDECIHFLRDIGPLVRAEHERQTAPEQRRLLTRSWDQVLSRYDADRSGNLSLQEQRELRRDRALRMHRLFGE